jgi:hypothetical protein
MSVENYGKKIVSNNSNKSLHESSNDNGDAVVNFTMSKNLIVKSIIF